MHKLDQQDRDEYMYYITNLLEGRQIEEFRQQFLELHPTDQIELYKSLTQEMRRYIYQYLSPAEFAEIFQGLELKEQQEYILELDQPYAVEMFNNMYSDDVASFLSVLDKETAALFLSSMSKKDAQDVQELLAYPPETAGAIMTTEFISISITNTISEVMERLRQEGPNAETIYYLYAVDKERNLVGVVSLRDLLISKLDQKIEEVMSTRVISVSVNTDQEEVAGIIKKYDFLALPVTANDKLVGIITVDDVIDIMENETTEDFGEISAAKGAVDLEISAFESVKKRLPWLVLLLFIGLLTAGIIQQFEETLERIHVLAFFMPLIAGMAGNTGTQSLAVVVRGLALGKLDRSVVFRLLKRDIITGLMIGVVCGIIVAMISQFIERDLLFGFILGFSLFCILIVATLAGTIVPLIINKLKIDPAVASGPFITTINDIIALSLYFSIATALLTNL